MELDNVLSVTMTPQIKKKPTNPDSIDIYMSSEHNKRKT